MHRVAALLALPLLLLAACSDGGGGPAGGPSTTVVDREAELPGPVAAFVDDIAEPGTVAFRGTYRVLQKLGGTETEVTVTANPPAWQLRVGDLVFTDGAQAATCRVSSQRCVGQVREQLLSGVGVFTGFFATAPGRALATDARRATAGELERSERVVAGVSLRCAGVPLSGLVASTYCLTPEGVVGYADTPAVRYELIDYAAGPPGEPVGAPFPITTGEL